MDKRSERSGFRKRTGWSLPRKPFVRRPGAACGRRGAMQTPESGPGNVDKVFDKMSTTDENITQLTDRQAENTVDNFFYAMPGMFIVSGSRTNFPARETDRSRRAERCTGMGCGERCKFRYGCIRSAQGSTHPEFRRQERASEPEGRNPGTNIRFRVPPCQDPGALFPDFV